MSVNAVTAKMLETAAALSPEDVTAYLTSHGWTDAGAYGSYARLYRLDGQSKPLEAVIPTVREVSDFEWRMIDLIGLLARIGDTDTDAVCMDLLPSGTGEAAERIQAQLNRLISDAKSQGLDDLAQFIGLALLAADDAKRAAMTPGDEKSPLPIPPAANHDTPGRKPRRVTHEH